MPKAGLIYLSVMAILVVLSGCSLKEPTISELPDNQRQYIDWSEVVMPSTGQIKDWPITVLGTIAFTVSDDGESLYAYAYDQDWVAKSTDKGNTWEFIWMTELLRDLLPYAPGGEIGLWGVKSIGGILYVYSFYDIFRSEDEGRTFDILPRIPVGIEQGAENLWCCDITLDKSGRPVFLSGVARLWTLSYPYEHWVDEGIPEPTWGINPGITQPQGYPSHWIMAAAFSPKYADDGQIVAVVNDETNTIVTTKVDDANWGATVGDAYLLDPISDPPDSWIATGASIVFPADYDSDVSEAKYIQYVGIKVEKVDEEENDYERN